jgi:hypothetical protein
MKTLVHRHIHEGMKARSVTSLMAFLGLFAGPSLWTKAFLDTPFGKSIPTYATPPDLLLYNKSMPKNKLRTAGP